MQETGELRCPIVSGQRPIQSFARNPETCPVLNPIMGARAEDAGVPLL
jgi:hypothetical protein